MEARILVIIGDSNEKFVKVKELLREASTIFLEYNMVDLYFDSLTVLINVLAYKLSDLNSAREIEEEYVIQFQSQVCHAESSELEDNYIEFMRRTASLLDAQGAYERMKNLFANNSIKDYLPKYKAYNDMIGYSIYEGELPNISNSIICALIYNEIPIFKPKGYWKISPNASFANYFHL